MAPGQPGTPDASRSRTKSFGSAGSVASSIYSRRSRIVCYAKAPGCLGDTDQRCPKCRRGICDECSAACPECNMPFLCPACLPLNAHNCATAALMKRLTVLNAVLDAETDETRRKEFMRQAVEVGRRLLAL